MLNRKKNIQIDTLRHNVTIDCDDGWQYLLDGASEGSDHTCTGFGLLVDWYSPDIKRRAAFDLSKGSLKSRN